MSNSGKLTISPSDIAITREGNIRTVNDSGFKVVRVRVGARRKNARETHEDRYFARLGKSHQQFTRLSTDIGGTWRQI